MPTAASHWMVFFMYNRLPWGWLIHFEKVQSLVSKESKRQCNKTMHYTSIGFYLSSLFRPLEQFSLNKFLSCFAGFLFSITYFILPYLFWIWSSHLDMTSTPPLSNYCSWCHTISCKYERISAILIFILESHTMRKDGVSCSISSLLCHY